MDRFFVPGDQLSAAKEIDAVGYTMAKILEDIEGGHIESAIQKHELVGRSLRELNRMRNAKKQRDKTEFILSQIKAHQESNISLIIRRLKDEQQG